ncbi:flavodoxin domain-containing protein [Blattabacterium cuenoti]|uniref:hypothetical protein n=1 Tax=Blattabacterium cuenoti TaxID=1653831 RepID=UPI00163B82ED|nr:hypothetical protein [Blattabacterium cuenoti]
MREKKHLCGIVLNNLLLNKKNNKSHKEFYHIEILMNESGDYSPGDSVAIMAENSSEEVHKIMNFLKSWKKIIFNDKNEKNMMFFMFKKKFNIVHLSRNMLSKYSFFSDQNPIYSNKKIWSFFDLLKKFPLKKEVQLKDFIELMDPIKPRLYSISSSPKAHNNTVIHITVLRHQFKIDGKIKYGYCSNFLSKLKKGDLLSFFIHRNHLFKLPKSNKDIILIGTGTGIAPFRSFLYEREINRSTGKNWLFFGNQYSEIDFLYQMEIKNWKKNGILNHINISFSRDQKKKIYVQDEIWKNRKEFYKWIKNGAYIYICGKKKNMSVDVENTLLRVIKEELGENSLEFLKKMKKNKRYSKDVY